MQTDRERLQDAMQYWERVALSTKPANRTATECAVVEAYRRGGLRQSPAVVWYDSPLECLEALSGMSHKGLLVASPLMKGYPPARKAMQIAGAEHYSNILFEHESPKACNHAWHVVRTAIEAATGIPLPSRDIRSLCGQFDAPWLGVFAVVKQLYDIPTTPLKGLWRIAEQANWFFPFEHVCFVSERPQTIHTENNILHNFDGPVIRYRDGFSAYAFRNMPVPKEYAETPADRLSPSVVLQEHNAELRKELVRKMGVERLLEQPHAHIIDEWNDYTLIQLELPNMRTRALYLKMLNPSTGAWHVEGVDPSVETCEEALAWRLGGIEWNPTTLT